MSPMEEDENYSLPLATETYLKAKKNRKTSEQ